MALTQITLATPSSAKVGSRVTVEAFIKNLTSDTIEATATKGRVNSTVLRFGASHKWLSPGQTKSWPDSFIMPDRNITISVESWVPDENGIWGSDDRESRLITISVDFTGTIIQKELEYDGSRKSIPVY
ncbi:hypothetical protein LCGC14_0977330 [marine sediment metagenome]|uniref:Arrestin-like N-terminal domain-containing protein n=1 Tax=marine sediment metagenome TaxID=412755 RepID=A0A0F9NW64_9ZZZZ